MYIAILVLVCLAESLGAAWFLWQKFGVVSVAQNQSTKELAEGLQKCEDVERQFNDIISKMASARELRSKGDEYKVVSESLKAELGRVAITKAELETVDNHLRELDVIERELEASAIETQEEISILSQKREVLLDKKEQLNAQLSAMDRRLSDAMAKVEMSSQVRETIDGMRKDLADTQVQIDELLKKIEKGHEQYAILKQRYDALDIEYAQLYERFTLADDS